MARTELAFAEEKSQARGFGMAAAILLIVALLRPLKLLTAFVLLALAAASWKFVFHGATAVSMSLSGSRRNLFRIAVATAFPLVLSWYFIKDTPSVTASDVIGPMASPWLLLPIALIGYVSWAAGEQLDQQHPFRGFLIASTVLFVICLLGYHGIHSEFDDQSETSYTIIDKEAASQAAQSGRYLGQILLYVGVSYAAMFAKFWKRHV